MTFDVEATPSLSQPTGETSAPSNNTNPSLGRNLQLVDDDDDDYMHPVPANHLL